MTEFEQRKQLKKAEENERYIRRKVKNMLAMSRKQIVTFGNFAVEIPDPELVEGMGFEWEKKCRKI